MVHSGSVEVSLPDGSVLLAAGDTFTTPKGVARAFRATSSEGCLVHVVRGGEEIAPPEFVRAKKKAA